MKNGVENASLHELLVDLVKVFAQEADKLNGLDAQLGDGDHGLSMLTGLRAVLHLTEENSDSTIDAFLSRGGLAFNEAAGSTIGILIMSAMKSAAASIVGKADLQIADAAAMLEAATKAITARGKAERGQKTIVDALAPATDALNACASQNASSLEAARAMTEAARTGAEGTVELASTVGRARWFKDRSVGVMDPGAWSGYLIVKTISRHIAEQRA